MPAEPVAACSMVFHLLFFGTVMVCFLSRQTSANVRLSGCVIIMPIEPSDLLFELGPFFLER